MNQSYYNTNLTMFGLGLVSILAAVSANIAEGFLLPFGIVIIGIMLLVDLEIL